MRRVIVLLAAVFLCSCKPSALEENRSLPLPENVLAAVGSDAITVEDLQAAMRLRPVGNDPAAREALLKELIEFRVLLQQAKARGYDRDPQLQHAFERMLVNKVRGELEAAEPTPEEVTQEEIDRYYGEHTKEFSVPTKIRVAMIFVEAPSSFTEEKRAERRARIEEARAKASTEDFSRLAAEYSYDQASKFNGGDLGYLVEGLTGADQDSVEPTVVAAAFALADPGQISDVIETPRGFSLLKLQERHAATLRSLRSVRNEIIARVRRDRAAQRKGNLATDVFAGTSIEVFHDRVAKVTAPQADAAAMRSRGATPPPLPAN
jgi:parvulin-like peptidyl-prolyl isomerase